MRVSCRHGNFTGGDQVSLALWLCESANEVAAGTAGGQLRMRKVTGVKPSGSYWEGDLRPAGLHDPPFNLPAGRHWYGRPRASAIVRVTTQTAAGEPVRTATRVPLVPGFG